MSTCTVLCVGGPVGGTWRAIDEQSFVVMEPAPVTWSDPDDFEVKKHVYYLDRVVLFGFDLRVAVCEREFPGRRERDKALIRALLQRDVAAQMGVL